MKDIAKMKADFTKQIEMAELENSINSKLLASLPNGYEIFLYEATGRKEKDRGVKYDLHTSVSVHNPHSKYRIGSTTYTANNRPSSSLATMSPALLSKELSILKNNHLKKSYWAY